MAICSMKKIVFLFLLLAFHVLTVFSQDRQPAASPTPPADDEVVRISTNLIQVDVTVVDSRGRAVTDLKPEELEIYENDKKQPITNFSFVAPVTNNTVTKTVEAQNETSGKKSAPLVPVPSVPLKPEKVGRTIAIVVDDLSLSYSSLYYARKALRKFVDEQMQPNDLVAIIRSGSGMGALQQFTSDKRQLYAAIERFKLVPITGKIGTFEPLAGGSPIPPPDQSDDSKNAGKEAAQMEADVLATGTLGAVNYVVRGMHDLPGRKTVILFSEGFSLNDDDGGAYRVRRAIRYLADVANRASVVIYTVDARGLQTLGLTAADDVTKMTLPQIDAAMQERSTSFMDSQEGLVYLADVTGGIAIQNTNDFNYGIQRVLDDQQGYYLVGYQPDDATFDPQKARFNKLTVKVTRPGLTARYRSGFFAVASEDVKPEPKTPQQQIMAALSSPFSSGDIALRLTPIFINDQKRGSFISSLIHIKASDMHFSDEADGWKKAVFNIVAVAYGDNGAVADQLAQTKVLRVRGDEYKNILANGFVYNVPFPIKKPGGYQMRIAFRDGFTSKIGSANQFIEVPDVKKDKSFLSGIILETTGKGKPAAGDTKGSDDLSQAQLDTALREFRTGSALHYNLVFFHPKIDKATGRPKLKIQAKLFLDGNEFFTGIEKDYAVNSLNDLQRIPITGAISLGTNMQPGQYLLQIIVTDTLAKEKEQAQTQWLDFEIVK
jgi:VWFA-related protein